MGGCTPPFPWQKRWKERFAPVVSGLIHTRPWADPGQGSRGSAPPPGPLCRLFNIGPKIGPPISMTDRPTGRRTILPWTNDTGQIGSVQDISVTGEGRRAAIHAVLIYRLSLVVYSTIICVASSHPLTVCPAVEHLHPLELSAYYRLILEVSHTENRVDRA